MCVPWCRVHSSQSSLEFGGELLGAASPWQWKGNSLPNLVCLQITVHTGELSQAESHCLMSPRIQWQPSWLGIQALSSPELFWGQACCSPFPITKVTFPIAIFYKLIDRNCWDILFVWLRWLQQPNKIVVAFPPPCVWNARVSTWCYPSPVGTCW